jgi:hypothetical protein
MSRISIDCGSAFSPPALLGLILPHMLQTEVKSQMNARKQAFATRASLSRWFASQQAHHGSGKDEPPRHATSLQKVPTVIVMGDWPEPSAKTASIRGSMT